MQVHGNAKLVPSTRLLFVRRVIEKDWKVADVAAAQSVSERTVYRWLARWGAGGPSAGNAPLVTVNAARSRGLVVWPRRATSAAALTTPGFG